MYVLPTAAVLWWGPVKISTVHWLGPVKVSPLPGRDITKPHNATDEEVRQMGIRARSRWIDALVDLALRAARQASTLEFLEGEAATTYALTIARALLLTHAAKDAFQDAEAVKRSKAMLVYVRRLARSRSELVRGSAREFYEEICRLVPSEVRMRGFDEMISAD